MTRAPLTSEKRPLIKAAAWECMHMAAQESFFSEEPERQALF